MIQRDPTLFHDDGCLTEDALGMVTSGQQLPEAALNHLDHCDRCAMRLAATDDATELLGELQGAASASPDPGDWAPPGYDIKGEIHRGAQGAVFHAWHPATKRDVAIKVLLGGRLSTTRQRLRFEREVELAAALSHPGIVAVHDSGVGRDGQPYVVMELVHGRTIDHHAASLPKTDARPRAVADLFASVCDAVGHAHQRGVIHRDLKPSNILVDKAGMPRLVDFGIARQQAGPEGKGSLTLTEGEAFLGTLGYAAPEQVEGRSAQADTRTDVYALGLVLYELLTGKAAQAADADSIAQAVRDITERTPTPPHRVNPDVHKDLSSIVMKAISKAPEGRYASASAMAEDLRRWLDNRPVLAFEAGAVYSATKFALRHKRAVGAAAAAALILAVGGATIATQAYRARKGEAARQNYERVFLAFDLEQSQGMNQEGALRRMAEDIDERFADYPEMQADAYLQIGRAMRTRDLYAESVERLSQAVAIRSAEFGDRSEPLAECLAERARSYRALGAYSSARGDYEAALGIYENHSGADSVAASEIRSELGSTIARLGELQQGEAMIRRAISALETTAAEEQLADAINSLAVCLSMQRRNSEAIAAAERSLTLVRGLTDPPPLAEARVLSALATYLTYNGELLRARETLSEALRLKRAWRGPESDDADVARTEFAIARVEQALAKGSTGADFRWLQSAKEHAAAAVALRSRVHRDRPHHDSASAMQLLGSIQIQIGEAADAIDALAKAIEMRKSIREGKPSESVTPNDIGWAQSHHLMAQALTRLGRSVEAIEYAETADILFCEIDRCDSADAVANRHLVVSLRSDPRLGG